MLDRYDNTFEFNFTLQYYINTIWRMCIACVVFSTWFENSTRYWCRDNISNVWIFQLLFAPVPLCNLYFPTGFGRKSSEVYSISPHKEVTWVHSVVYNMIVLFKYLDFKSSRESSVCVYIYIQILRSVPLSGDEFSSATVRLRQQVSPAKSFARPKLWNEDTPLRTSWPPGTDLILKIGLLYLYIFCRLD